MMMSEIVIIAGIIQINIYVLVVLITILQQMKSKASENDIQNVLIKVKTMKILA